MKRAQAAIDEAGVTTDGDIRRAIRELPFPPRGPAPYLNEADVQLLGEVISLRGAVGQPPHETTIKTEVLDIVRGREENAGRNITCNKKYMQKLIKKMKDKALISRHKPAPVSLSRAKQHDPALVVEMRDELKGVWKEHLDKGLLEDEVPKASQLFNMDEIA